jgi:uncharacterized delta-60 repeat protein
VAGSYVYETVAVPPALPAPQPGEVVPFYLSVVNLHHFFVARFNSDGTLDQTFGNGGVVLTSFGSDDTASALVLQPDNKIIVAGSSDGAFAVARFNPDGTLDATFGNGGKAIFPIGTNGTASASTVALEADGKIIVAGSADGEFAIARLNADGSLDATFGSQGTTETAAGVDGAGATQAAIESDGDLLAVGYQAVASPANGMAWEAVILCYTSDGQLDPSFGQGGEVQTGVLANNYWRIREALQADGKIVVATDELGGPADLVLARYTETGRADATFGDGGQAAFSLNGGMGDMALQPDGKIVVAVGADPELARFTNDAGPLIAQPPAATVEEATSTSKLVASSKEAAPPVTLAPTFGFAFSLGDSGPAAPAVVEIQTSAAAAATSHGANAAGVVIAGANSFAISAGGGPAINDNGPVIGLDYQPLLWPDPVLDDVPAIDAAWPIDTLQSAEIFPQAQPDEQTLAAAFSRLVWQSTQGPRSEQD